ncbi:MAG: aquaporin [Betaproteobacteria bacterium]|nr:aquaporin [Betaproteobacteria bacterium]
MKSGDYHWPEYFLEALGLGLFMLSACAFTALLEHPASFARQAVPDPFTRRALIALAMGLTAIGLIYSPLGKRSGAHLNPAVTATFWRLGRIHTRDAMFYTLFQFAGGTAGVVLFSFLFGTAVIADAAVNYAVTVPGMAGRWPAFLAEALISGGLMFTVLTVSNRPALNRYTGLFAGVLVALFIVFEAPLSGMSMNPARTFASALPARVWTDAWIYFLAPVAGMLIAAELYLMTRGRSAVLCCKLHHENDSRCIFPCRYRAHQSPAAA